MLGEKINVLKKELIEYATLVEQMIDHSIEGLSQRNVSVFDEVLREDEPQANAMELDLDEKCTVLIAQYQPKARDLRTILMILKMTNDLERIADHSVNISQSGLFLVDKPPVKPLMDIPRMADITKNMLKDSITAFINEDAVLARQVCERDNSVDDLKDQIVRELITFMVSDPSTIERALHLMRVSGNLERIADLSTNVCEDVIFMVEGRVIKHHQNETELE